MKKVLILGGNSDIGVKIINTLINEKKISLTVHFNKKFPIKKIKKIKATRLN